MTDTSGSAPDAPEGQPSPGQQPPPTGQPPTGQPPTGQPPYGQPGWAPQPMSPSDERLWSLLAHLSYFVLGIIGPLIIMLTKGKESAFVRNQSVEALNFHITLVIAFVVSVVLMLVTAGILFFLPFAVWVVGVVFAIMAAVASNKGEWYRYPMNIRMVK